MLESGLEALEEAPSTVHQVSQASQESQESEGRQGRRSAHSGYDMDTRGRIVAADNASQATCSLSHLPTKTPQLTVRYATGDDPAAFASLAAQLLLSQTPQQTSTSAATQLPDMVSRLVNTARVFPPASPCTAPVSLDNADLVAWDCSAHLQHVRRLLQMVSRLTIMAHYHIGGFLGQVISRSNAATAQERQWCPRGHRQCCLHRQQQALPCNPCIVRMHTVHRCTPGHPAWSRRWDAVQDQRGPC